MNRVLGDYLETLLYKIFVSIDEHTTVSEVKKLFSIQINSCHIQKIEWAHKVLMLTHD